MVLSGTFLFYTSDSVFSSSMFLFLSYSACFILLMVESTETCHVQLELSVILRDDSFLCSAPSILIKFCCFLSDKEGKEKKKETIGFLLVLFFYCLAAAKAVVKIYSLSNPFLFVRIYPWILTTLTSLGMSS